MSETATRERRIINARTPRPATGVDTVVVGLKLPNGLVLQGFVKKQVNVATPLGFRAEEVYDRTGKAFALKGNAQMLDLQHRMGLQFNSGGYAITIGVPRDLWDQWYDFNRESPLVENHLIFAEDSLEAAEARGRELSKVRSGLEPIDPEHPEYHAPKSRNKHVSTIQQGET